MKLARKLRKSGPGLTPCWREVVAQVIHVKFMYSMDRYEGNSSTKNMTHLGQQWPLTTLSDTVAFGEFCTPDGLDDYTSIYFPKKTQVCPHILKDLSDEMEGHLPPKKRLGSRSSRYIYIYYMLSQMRFWIEKHQSQLFLGANFKHPKLLTSESWLEFNFLPVGWQAMGISLPEHLAYGRGSRFFLGGGFQDDLLVYPETHQTKRCFRTHCDKCKLYIYIYIYV